MHHDYPKDTDNQSTDNVLALQLLLNSFQLKI